MESKVIDMDLCIICEKEYVPEDKEACDLCLVDITVALLILEVKTTITSLLDQLNEDHKKRIKKMLSDLQDKLGN